MWAPFGDIHHVIIGEQFAYMHKSVNYSKGNNLFLNSISVENVLDKVSLVMQMA